MLTEVVPVATLYLRGVPDSLVREAKSAAARRGITLTALVTEALSLALGRDVGAEEGLPAELQNERAWFEARRGRLLARYRGEYVAIVNRRIIDHDRDFGALAARVFRRLGVRPVFMPRCVEGDRVVEIPSPVAAGT